MAVRLILNYKRLEIKVWDDSGEYYDLESCSDTFFNTNRSVLNEAIVDAFNYSLDNPDSCFAELNEELISQISKTELRII